MKHFTKNFAKTLLVLTGVFTRPLVAFAMQAQPVPIPESMGTMPQVEIDGTGIASVNYGNPIENGKVRYAPGIDFSDSSLLIGGAQRLYNNGIGSLGFGVLSPDEGNAGTTNPLFVHQAFVDYQAESAEFLIGRSDNRASHLVDFPTLREEDLITFTNPLDPFSNGSVLEEHRYANVASFTLNQDLTYFEDFHAQHLIDSQGIGSTSTSLNSFGAHFEYLCAPGMEPLSRVVSYGIGYEYETISQPSTRGLNQVSAGGLINLNQSLVDRVDFRAQDLVNFGSSLKSFQNLNDTYQASYNAIAGSVRYLHNPFGQPGYQISLTGGYRSFFGIDQAGSWGLAVTAAKRLGEGFDLVAQYATQWRAANLAAQYQGQTSENVGQIGLVFNFSGTFNPHISPRRTPLNTQHQYIPD
ncbi:MAG: hypothetical protein P4M08_15270 [Oligoflexia bacterium]|nr:hypothetical protein [Oligoflexia bacterium]